MSALNAIVPYDWAGFFHSKLDSTSAEAPLGGIENGGWKLEFNSEPSKSEGRRDVRSGDVYSIGLQLGPDGTVGDALVGGPAFEAGLSSGMKVIGVNGRVYTQAVLDDAVKGSKDSTQPITLLAVDDDYIRTFTINYHGGERHPHLVQVSGQQDYLDELIKPRTASK
jgi:predicted metalloprotease with PDZ domain